MWAPNTFHTGTVQGGQWREKEYIFPSSGTHGPSSRFCGPWILQLLSMDPSTKEREEPKGTLPLPHSSALRHTTFRCGGPAYVVLYAMLYRDRDRQPAESLTGVGSS